MNNIHIPIITCLVILSLTACIKEKETKHDYPCVDTGQVTDINANGVTFNGSFRQPGSGEIIDHGFAFSEDVLPSLHNEYISLGTSAGSGGFSAKATYAMKAGKTYYVCAYARNKEKTYFGQVNSFISAGSYPPEIYEVIPAQGIKSDTVTIKGANIGRFNNKVLFGSQGAGIISASNSEIVVQVPSSKGQSQVDISITVAGQTANKPAGFTYQLPFISSITPDKGKPGEAITIKGGAFSAIPEVYIGNYVLLITHYTRDEINCIIPRQTPALTGNVRVISDGRSVASETSFEIIR